MRRHSTQSLADNDSGWKLQFPASSGVYLLSCHVIVTAHFVRGPRSQAVRTKLMNRNTWIAMLLVS